LKPSAPPDADAAFSPKRIWWESILTGGRIFVVAASGLTFTYLAATNSVVEQTRINLKWYAEAGAALIDPAAQRQLLQASDLGSPAYFRAAEPLVKLQRSIPEIYYAYGLIPGEGGLRFTFDTSYYIVQKGDEDSHLPPPGELYDDSPLAARQALISATTTVSEKPYTDKWGTFLSAFAPVRKGHPEDGFVGIDISLKTLNDLLHPLRVALVLSLAGSAMLAIAAGVGSFRSLKAQAKAVRELAKARTLAELAAEEAKSANKAKSAFLASVSHEIRTPLNGVLGLTGIVLDSELNASQRECLQTVQRSGESLLAVLNDVLDFSKIEAGRLELELLPIDLRRLLEEVLDLSASSAQAKGLELALLWEPGVPETVVTDPTRLRQILLNLVGNAVKFTNEGEVILQAELVTRREDGSVELAFTIRDTGTGIPASIQERLFKPFSQGDASTTRHHGGTGLGLVISERLARFLGGDIHLVVSDGNGSVFRFTIEAAAPTTDTSGSATLGDSAAASLAERRLLVVMANGGNRQLLERQAEAWGLKAMFATSGAEALALLDHQEIDLALLDRQLIDMDGPTLAGALRAHPRGDHLPLILLTLVGEQLHSPVAMGMLSKPIKTHLLLQELLRALNPSVPPYPTPSEAAIPPEGEASELFDGDFALRHPMRILVAEDNAVNRRVCELLFQHLGYGVEFATDGEMAVECQEAHDPDLILMDVQMPNLDGHEATRRIRLHTGQDDRPWIVALTADARPSVRAAALESGMNDFLSKPIDKDTFHGMVLRAHGALGRGSSA
jgi:signal transduction histidine kinase/CheY-like chemotaxis protein